MAIASLYLPDACREYRDDHDHIRPVQKVVLRTDYMGWGEADKPLSGLIDAFDADRVESMVTSKRSYSEWRAGAGPFRF
jgi:hypothetical protein